MVDSVRPLQLFSKEKLAEFRSMSLEARLGWLEEANALFNLMHGSKKRAQFDERFRDLPSENPGSLSDNP